MGPWGSPASGILSNFCFAKPFLWILQVKRADPLLWVPANFLQSCVALCAHKAPFSEFSLDFLYPNQYESIGLILNKHDKK